MISSHLILIIFSCLILSYHILSHIILSYLILSHPYSIPSHLSRLYLDPHITIHLTSSTFYDQLKVKFCHFTKKYFKAKIAINLWTMKNMQNYKIVNLSDSCVCTFAQRRRRKKKYNLKKASKAHLAPRKNTQRTHTHAHSHRNKLCMPDSHVCVCPSVCVGVCVCMCVCSRTLLTDTKRSENRFCCHSHCPSFAWLPAFSHLVLHFICSFCSSFVFLRHNSLFF